MIQYMITLSFFKTLNTFLPSCEQKPSLFYFIVRYSVVGEIPLKKIISFLLPQFLFPTLLQSLESSAWQKTRLFCETFGDKDRNCPLQLFEGILAVPSPFDMMVSREALRWQHTIYWPTFSSKLAFLEPFRFLLRNLPFCCCNLLAVDTQVSASRNACFLLALESLALYFAISSFYLRWGWGIVCSNTELLISCLN